MAQERYMQRLRGEPRTPVEEVPSGWGSGGLVGAIAGLGSTHIDLVPPLRERIRVPPAL